MEDGGPPSETDNLKTSTAPNSPTMPTSRIREAGPSGKMLPMSHVALVGASEPSSASRPWKIAFAGMTLAFLAAIIALIIVGVRLAKGEDTCSAWLESATGTGQGLTSSARDATGDVPVGPFAFEELTADELTATVEYLLAQDDLGLVEAAGDKSDISANTILLVEFLAPSKAKMLRHLDDGGTAPDRYARAVIYLGETSEVKELKVGPMPTPTGYSQIETKGATNINFDSRPPIAGEYARLDELLVEATSELEVLLKESYAGYTYADCSDKCLWYTDSGPRGDANSPRQTWFLFVRYLEGNYLQPVGLDILIDHSGNDPSTFSVKRIYYGRAVYDSAADLMAQYNDESSGIYKVVLGDPADDMYLYSSYTVREPARQDSEIPGPIPTEPKGRRFTVIRNQIEYQGWKFQFGASPTTGLRFWDVNFRGERIIYEMSMQEALAGYGGWTPAQANTFYLDSAWGLGNSFQELVHGVDCPENAVYVDLVQMSQSSTPVTYPKALCVFERVGDIPLRRHFDKDFGYRANGYDLSAYPNEDFTQGYTFYSGLPDYTLVIRGIAAVYNYDYVIDTIFHANGVIECDTHFTGYAQGALREHPHIDPMFGYPLYTGAGGTVHNHILSWKIDLDIDGTANSFRKDAIEARRIYNPYLEKEIDQIFINSSIAETEEDAKILMDPGHPMFMAVINENSNNSWGTHRGYQIKVDSVARQLLNASWPAVSAASFSKYQVAVSLRKEDEPFSSTIYSQGIFEDIPLDFETEVLDGDAIREEDLVVWVAVGGWHIPCAEDAPSTPTAGNSHKFVLRPYNFFDEDGSTDSARTRIVRPDADTGAPIEGNNAFVDATGEGNCVRQGTSVPFVGFF